MATIAHSRCMGTRRVKIIQRKQVSKALRRFSCFLERAGEGPERTRGHLGRMVPFAEFMYLDGCGGTPMETSPLCAEAYMMADHHIRYRGRPFTTVGASIDTLRRWYEFLASEGAVTQEVLDDARLLLGQRHRFEQRFRDYASIFMGGEPSKDMLWSWQSRSYDHEPPTLLPDSSEGKRPFGLPTPSADLMPVLREHGVDRLPILRDFEMMVRSVPDEGLPLTDTNAWLTRRDLARINRARKAPERMGRHADSPDLPVLHSLVALARCLELLQEDGHRRLLPGPGRARFLDHDRETQYWALLGTYWNHLDWTELGRPARRWDPALAQSIRDVVAGLVLDDGSDPETDFAVHLGVAAMMLTGVGMEVVMPTLAAFGLLEGGGKYRSMPGDKLRFATPTPLGRRVLPELDEGSPPVRDPEADECGTCLDREGCELQWVLGGGGDDGKDSAPPGEGKRRSAARRRPSPGPDGRRRTPTAKRARHRRARKPTH